MNITHCRRCSEWEGAGTPRPVCTLFVQAMHFNITSSDLKPSTRHVTAQHIKWIHKMPSQASQFSLASFQLKPINSISYTAGVVIHVCNCRVAHIFSAISMTHRERLHHKHPNVNMQDSLDLLCSAITNTARKNLGSLTGSF